MSTGQAIMLGFLLGSAIVGVPAWVLQRLRRPLTSQQYIHVLAARTTLERCRAQFEFYATEHVNKGSTQKAETNRSYAFEAHQGVRVLDRLMQQRDIRL